VNGNPLTSKDPYGLCGFGDCVIPLVIFTAPFVEAGLQHVWNSWNNDIPDSPSNEGGSVGEKRSR